MNAPAPSRPTALATTLLIGVTAIWGSTFVVVKDAVAQMPVMDFLAVRFGVAALVMLAIRPRALAGLGRQGWQQGIGLGLALGLGYVGQTFGLQHTSAAVSGFITGMFVVFTPLIAGLVLRRRIGGGAWSAVGLATVGLALLSLRGFAVGFGELLTLSCAICFAVHIVGLGEWSVRHNAYSLAVVQMLTVAALSTVAAAPGGVSLPPNASVWVAVGITAVLATAAAFLIQTWAQALITPTRAAVVMTMEPVFAGLFGVFVAHEVLGVRGLIGALFVLSAMYFVELGPRHAAEGGIERLE